MKKIKKFIFINFLILVFFLTSSSAKAFDASQLDDCILSATQNPSIEGVSESSIKGYCECALDLIVDKITLESLSILLFFA